jgi:hypothetical protein
MAGMFNKKRTFLKKSALLTTDFADFLINIYPAGNGYKREGKSEKL